MARERLSAVRKIAAGTARLARFPIPSAVEPLTEPPPPPAYLSKGAKAEWTPLAHALVALGVIIDGDLRSLALLCEALATETALRAQVAREGSVLTARNGTCVMNPAAKLLESTRNQAARMLASFGLDPKGRQCVDMQPRADPNALKSGLAKFM